MSENETATRTSYRRSDDGSRTELTLTVSTELLEALAEVADQAHYSYSHGADDEAETLFADELLGPLSSLLYRAAQNS
jgi:hypothetical protein